MSGVPNQAVPIWWIHVLDVVRLSPHMARVTFGGEDLAGLGTVEPDQQVKLYFPRPGQRRPRLPEPGHDFMAWYQRFQEIPADEQPWQRSYTIRAHDAKRRQVTVDFVLHPDAGPATRWADEAEPGDTIAMFGPSSTFARPTPLRESFANADWVLLAGDDTALPAIGSIIENVPASTRVVAFVELADPADQQSFDTAGQVTVHWVDREGARPGRSTALADAVRAASFPPGSPFAWIAGESTAVRTLRRHLIGDRGLHRKAVEFSGHWRLALSQDDPPTETDLAEARERLADLG